jgi:anti-sigma B factor antagonist
MLLTISTRSVDDVIIVDLDGSITLGEESSALRDIIRKLLRENRKKILLNMAKVKYIDSGGNGTLVSAYTAARNENAILKFVNLTRKIQDLFQVTKLFTVYEVFDDESSAIRSFQAPLQHCYCPVCRTLAKPQFCGKDDSQIHSCGKYDSRFSVSYSQSPQRQLLVKRLLTQTYQSEYVEVFCGTAFTVSIVGRLDPFSFPTLSRIWASIPTPRKVLVDLRRTSEVDRAVANALLPLVEGGKGDGKAVISVEGLAKNYLGLFQVAPPLYSNRGEALAAIEGIADACPWPVAIDSH